MRKLVGGLAAVATAVVLMPAGANAGVVQVRLSTQPSSIGGPGGITYYDPGAEANNVTVAKSDTSVTLTERGGLLVPEIINGLDVLNPLRFLQVCTLGLTSTTCKVKYLNTSEILTGRGNDRIDATPSSGFMKWTMALVPGPGNDTVIGSPSDDDIDVRDLERDEVTCGAGVDSVIRDAIDVVAADCENLF